jgi:hypothetical protein
MEGERTDASRASAANQITDVYMLALRECNGFVYVTRGGAQVQAKSTARVSSATDFAGICAIDKLLL